MSALPEADGMMRSTRTTGDVEGDNTDVINGSSCGSELYPDDKV